jgi:hypothetical protein
MNLTASARRHLEAATILVEPRPDVAGYLFGIAAECAIKAMMQEANIQIKPETPRREDPYFAHFPELRTMLRDMRLGRNAKPLMDFIGSDAFMNNWSTKMRYCSAREIRAEWVSAWSVAASQAVASIGT